MCDQRLRSSFPSSRDLSGLSGTSQQNEAFACGDRQADTVLFSRSCCVQDDVVLGSAVGCSWSCPSKNRSLLPLLASLVKVMHQNVHFVFGVPFVGC